MKKLLLLALLVLTPIGVYAFTPATLYKEANRVAVYTQEQAQKLFSQGYKLETNLLGYTPTTGYSERLTQSITNSATTIYVSSVVDRDNLALPLTATNKGYFTIEPGTAREEAIVCTGVSTSTVTLSGCTRGLLATGGSEAGGGLKYSHNAGSRIIMTNIAQFYGNYVDVNSNQTIGGIKTFTSIPLIPTSTPTTDNQAASKSYVDGVAIQGSPTSTVSTAGIGKISSAPSVASSPVFLNSEEVATTTGNDKVIRAKSNGKINQNWLDLTEGFAFSGTNSLSGTLNVSATTTFSALTKVATSTPTVAGQVVGLDSNAKLPAIDGSQLTNVQLTNKIGSFTKAMSEASATQTISHGLGITPKILSLFCHFGISGSINHGASSGYRTTSTSTVAWMGSTTGSNNTNIAYLIDGGGNQIATSTIDTTNITLYWVKSGSPSATDASCAWWVQ